MERPAKMLDFLIVEDEALLAMDIEAMVEDCGHRVVADAASLGDVEALAHIAAPDVALVDVQLAKGSSGIDVSTLIQARWSATMIVFVTANPKKLPVDLGGAHGVIAKPFSRNGLMAALNYIQESVIAPPPSSSRPDSFQAAPSISGRWDC